MVAAQNYIHINKIHYLLLPSLAHRFVTLLADSTTTYRDICNKTYLPLFLFLPLLSKAISLQLIALENFTYEKDSLCRRFVHC
jgi:hypothetical protein